MKRIRRLVRAWNEPRPTSVVINLSASPADPHKAAEEIEALLLKLRRRRGGRPLKFE